MRADVCAILCVPVFVHESVCDVYDLAVLLVGYLKQLTQSTFQENRCIAGCYLAIAKHDNPHQHHIDPSSQRLVMVDLIHLETHRETHIHIHIL